MSQPIAQFRQLFFDREKVLKAVDVSVRRNLSKFGAFTRRRAKSSIKNVPKKLLKAAGGREVYSEPGKPPFSRTGLLKKFIYFGYEPETKTVVIGPAAFKSNPVAPELLEHGGTAEIVRPKSIQRARYAARPYMAPAAAAEMPKFLDGLRDSI